MPGLDDRFLNRENFYFAFKKLSSYYNQANEWYNPIELAAYEANLSQNISSIISCIEDGKYVPKPLQPLPFPKKSDGDNKKLRQYFRVHLDDQLIWIAIVNIIGEKIETSMPFWNYGNRLYRPIWYEFDEKENVNILKKGSFKNTSPHFYRTWNQSWPMYRRHISITVKTMAHGRNFDKNRLDDDKEIELFEQEQAQNFDEVKYLDPSFWTSNECDNLFWIGLDFKKFFPSVQVEKIYSTINELLHDRSDVNIILGIIKLLLQFPLDITSWDKQELLNSELCGLKNIEEYEGLPTGLLVAGFLANVAMIDVDQKITNWILNRNDIAVFKYVDDHVVLGRDENVLKDFLDFYLELLNTSKTGVSVNQEKMLPTDAFELTENGVKWKENSAEYTVLDIDFPEPLMTQTLKKMSNLNEEEFELDDEEDIARNLTDLEQFLITDFPEMEMRKDTRMSFAAMKLCRLAKHIQPNYKKIDCTLDENIGKIQSVYFEKFGEIYDISHTDTIEQQSTKKRNRKKGVEASKFEFIKNQLGNELQVVQRKQERIFKLLIKAIRENPDKIKLWKRCIEFCYCTGLKKMEAIFDEAFNSKLHEEGKIYVYTFCLQTIQEYALRASTNLNSATVTFWTAFTSRKFIEGLQENTYYKRIKKQNATIKKYPFVNETIDYYNFVLAFVLHRDNYPADAIFSQIYYFENTEEKSSSWIDNQYLGKHKNVENLLWYLIGKNSDGNKQRLWEKNIDILSLNKAITWSIISLYPQKMPLHIYEKIQKAIGNSKKSNNISPDTYNFKHETGFLFDVFKDNPKIRKQYLNDFPALKNVFNRKTKKSYIALDEWVSMILKEEKQQESKSWTDARISEWTFLEIIRQVAELISTQLNKKIFDNNFHLYQIHPSNYLIPKQWIEVKKDELTWNLWRSIVIEFPMILTKENEFIDDYRYMPMYKMWKRNYAFLNGEIPVVIGLTVLLTKIISRSFEWPSASNKIKFIDELFSSTVRLLDSEPVSSDTRIFISAILSKNDIEVFFKSEVIHLNDKVSIRNLSDYARYIGKLQAQLEKQQLTLLEREPRQLIKIDLDNLMIVNNTFTTLYHE